LLIKIISGVDCCHLEQPIIDLAFRYLTIASKMTDQKFLATLGFRIKQIRIEKEMTQNELAITCDFEKASMSRIESGKTNVSILTLRKIAKALDVKTQELLFIE
jgi:DNA-binding XRE family transcriptional regulator